jgi:cell division septation protein DedD
VDESEDEAPLEAAPLIVASAAAAAIAEADDAPPAVSGTRGGYLIQVGAFSKLENAERAAEALAGRGQVTIKPLVLRGLTLHRVLLGSWPTRAAPRPCCRRWPRPASRTRK